MITKFQLFENYRIFDKENIGDIVTCYQLPSYGYHTLKIGKKYEIVDTRDREPFYEIKVKPIEDESLRRGDEYDRYYLDVYFMPDDVKMKRREINKNANKYNL